MTQDTMGGAGMELAKRGMEFPVSAFPSTDNFETKKESDLSVTLFFVCHCLNQADGDFIPPGRGGRTSRRCGPY